MVMKDISRFEHRRRLGYAAVRLQQARPHVDADPNAQLRLLEDEQRVTMQHLVGPKASHDRGFVLGEPFIIPEYEAPVLQPPRVYTEQTAELRRNEQLRTETVKFNGGEATTFSAFTLRAGKLLLGGQPLVLERAEHFAFQRDFLQMKAADLALDSERTLYALYSWEQVVTSREDEELSEPLLQNSPSAVRVRRMRQVITFPKVPEIHESCRDFFDYLKEANSYANLDLNTSELKSKGRLHVSFLDRQIRGRCAPEGAENLTLRVLLTAANRFVWSVDKPQIFRVEVTGFKSADSSLQIKMLDRPTNEAELPLAGRVVELIPFGALLDGGRLSDGQQHVFSRKIAAEIGAFTRVTQGYDEDTQSFKVDRSYQRTFGISFDTTVAGFVRQWDDDHPDAETLNFGLDKNNDDPPRYFYLRLWHDAPTTDDIEVDALKPVTLADLGVTLTLTPGLVGDHWYVSLRWSNPGVTEHEFLSAPGAEPHGPRRLLTPLALIDRRKGKELVVDCMPRLERTTSDSCVTFTVGDGITSYGDFSSIQSAIDALPSQGGKITVLPGVYSDELRIVRRRNLVITGCGDSTILETRQRAPSYGQCDIVASENITLQGLRFNSVEQSAIRLRDCMEVKLLDLHFISGIHDGAGQFIPGAWSTYTPLIDCVRSAVIDFNHLRLFTAQRPGLRFFSSELVELADIHLEGLAGKDHNQTQVTLGASQPMVTFSGCSLVRFRKSELKTFGQVGVSVRGRSQDVWLSHLNVFATHHRIVASLTTNDDVSPPTLTVTYATVAESRSCVDVESGERVTLERSNLTMSTEPSDHAALVLKGADLTVRHNTIEAQTTVRAWGGIQIRGGSERVELRYNRIHGGVGHGITLGSVYWRPASSPSPYSSPYTHRSPASGGRRREGAGQAQMRLVKDTNNATGLAVDLDLGSGFSDEGGLDYLPVPEGAIFDLVIADNRIEAMNTSGISVLTVMGLRQHGAELFEIERARIENNVITGNLTWLGNRLPTVVSELMPFPAALAGTGLRVPVLPLGGIILSAASAIDIRNNSIYDNGTTQSDQPITGVFVLTGDTINILGNRITNNGSIAVASSQAPGVRAGIAVMLAGTGPIDDLDELSPVLEGRVLLDSEGSSLRILGNNVVQPSGRALHVVATGPVTIQGNFFSSQSAQGSTAAEDLFAIGDVVYVQNLGMPWEAFNVGSLMVDRPRLQRSPEWLGTESLTEDEIDALSPTGDAGSPLHGTEQFFTQYTTPPKLAPYLRNSSYKQQRFFVGEGGRVSFADNQVVFAWENIYERPSNVRVPAPLCYVPVAIVGLDHVAVTGNHFGMRLGNDGDGGITGTDDANIATWTPPLPGETEAALAQVMVIGATIDVSRNRIASPVQDVSASLITFAEALSVVSLNQTTRAIYATTAVDYFTELGIDTVAAPPNSSLSREFGNQVLYEEADHLRASMKSMLTFCSKKLLQLPESADSDIEVLI